MPTAIAIFNQKGGAGKTPVTINLAGAISRSWASVYCSCDLDGQVALTTSIGFDSDVYEDSGDSIYTLITELEGDVNKVIRPAPNDELRCPAWQYSDVFGGESVSSTARNRERRLELIFEGIERQLRLHSRRLPAQPGHSDRQCLARLPPHLDSQRGCIRLTPTRSRPCWRR